MSPHAVFQVPKSACSLSDAVASDSRSCSGVTLLGRSPTATPPLLASPPNRRRTSSPQNTASEVGTEVALQRKSHLRRSAICSASFAFWGLVDEASSQALTRAGIVFSNQGR